MIIRERRTGAVGDIYLANEPESGSLRVCVDGRPIQATTDTDRVIFDRTGLDEWTILDLEYEPER